MRGRPLRQKSIGSTGGAWDPRGVSGIEIVAVDERDSSWEQGHPRFRDAEPFTAGRRSTRRLPRLRRPVGTRGPLDHLGVAGAVEHRDAGLPVVAPQRVVRSCRVVRPRVAEWTRVPDDLVDRGDAWQGADGGGCRRHREPARGSGCLARGTAHATSNNEIATASTIAGIPGRPRHASGKRRSGRPSRIDPSAALRRR